MLVELLFDATGDDGVDLLLEDLGTCVLLGVEFELLRVGTGILVILLFFIGLGVGFVVGLGLGTGVGLWDTD